MTELALIGLGSNLGDRKSLLDSAVVSLSNTPGIRVLAVSSYHETAAVGGPGNQGTFLNAAAALETTIEPGALLDRLHAIEHEAHRIRTVRWGERTLDLDLLLYGDRVIDAVNLRVPHPRMALRRFVLAPLCEIAPDAVDPKTRRTIRALLANLDRRPSYVAVARPFEINPVPFLDMQLKLDGHRFLSGLNSLCEQDKGLSQRLRRALPCLGIQHRIPPDEMLRRVETHLADGSAESFRERLRAARSWLDTLPSIWLACSQTTSIPSETWLISEFWFDVAFLIQDSLRTLRPRFPWYGNFLEARSKVISPTFVVATNQDCEHFGLNDPHFDWQRPIGRDTPILLVNDFDSNETFEEVLATCAATRSG